MNNIIIEALQEKRDKLIDGKKLKVEARDKLSKEIDRVDMDIMLIDNEILIRRNDYALSQSKNQVNYNIYDPKFTIAQKIEFVLNNHKRFMKLGEIALIMMKYENPEGQIKKFKDMVKQQLNIMRSRGKLVSFRESNVLQFTYYGLPDWIEDNKIKPEYMYNNE